MRSLFRDRSDSAFAEPPSRASMAWKHLWATGTSSVVFCTISTLGFLFGIFTGTAIVPGRSGIHFIALTDSPIWFSVAMVANGIVAVIAGGYFWLRVLGR